MSRHYDLAVVGSGIVGLGAAYAGIRRGLSVIVIDRAASIHGASVRNFGHLCIGAQSGRARDFADVSRDIWRSLAEDAGFWLRESGTVVAARHADELAVLAAAAGDDLQMLDADDVRALAPIDDPRLLGGARIIPDLQTNPREAAASIAVYLASRGVEFRMRTNVLSVASGVVHTSRGPISAGHIVVATGHDIDHVLPGLAESVGVERCQLDMLRVDAALPAPLGAPLLTGWSLARYGRFAESPETDVLRQRLHRRDVDAPPFQPEAAMDAFLDEASTLFGIARPRVLERWLGVYATAPDDFLIEDHSPGVQVLIVTTGIGMTTGLGLAEAALQSHFGAAPAFALEGIS